MTRLAWAALAVFLAAPAWAQQLSLDIRDGLVTLQASNVPARQILAEWARVGGTRVVGGERVAGAPLTLFLEGVPEAKALDISLRGAAGYMAANRAVPGTGRSRYDRIMVLASSTPPAKATPSALPASAIRRCAPCWFRSSLAIARWRSASSMSPATTWTWSGFARSCARLWTVALVWPAAARSRWKPSAPSADPSRPLPRRQSQRRAKADYACSQVS
jgi:hypothetical protein